MTTPRHDTDVFARWAGEMRDRMIEPLDPARIDAITSAVAVGATSTLIATAAAQAAQGGMMTASAATTAAASGSTAAKIMAGSLAAALTAGGAAAVTGNLPDGAQNFTADLAAHVGLELPRANAQLDLNGVLDLSFGEVLNIAGAGEIAVGLDADGNLVLAGIDAATGFTARVVSETTESIMITFESAVETTTVIITEVEGQLVSSVNTTLNAVLDSGAGVQGDADADASFNGSAETDGGSAEAEGSATVGIKIGG